MTLSKLPDIDEVAPLGPADAAIFAEIRDVLARHDALSRFGVTLLHQHFDVADDEVLVEHIDVEHRTLITSPLQHDPEAKGIETSWRLDDPSGMQRCETQCRPDRDYEGRPIHMRPHYTTG